MPPKEADNGKRTTILKDSKPQSQDSNDKAPKKEDFIMEIASNKERTTPLR